MGYGVPPTEMQRLGILPGLFPYQLKGHVLELQDSSIKIKLRSFKSSEHIKEKEDGSYHGFGYLSLFSDPIYLAT